MSEQVVSHSLRALIRADFEQALLQGESFRIGSAGLWRRIGMALEPPLLCVLLHRLAHAAWRRGRRRLARALAGVNRLVLRAEIDPSSDIGPGLYIPHPTAVMLAASAGRRLVVFANAIVAPWDGAPGTAGRASHGPLLGDDVVVGFNAIVLGPVAIGDGARIGGGAVVVEDVPAGGIRRSVFRGVKQ